MPKVPKVKTRIGDSRSGRVNRTDRSCDLISYAMLLETSVTEL
jgi:hypothetical protein